MPESRDGRVKRDREGNVRCRVCDCTETRPCEPPCSWAEPDLCSACHAVLEKIAEWWTGAYKPSMAGLQRELKRSSALARVPF